MKNFLTGLLLGWLATYWYFTEGDYFRMAMSDFWQRASSPPAVARQAR